MVKKDIIGAWNEAKTDSETLDLVNTWCNDYMASNDVDPDILIALIQKVTQGQIDARPKTKIGWASESPMLDGM